MSDWQPLPALPDLRRVGTIGFDTEERDGGLLTDHGPGWPWRDGHIAGVSVAYRAEGTLNAHYFPIRHPDSQNFDPANVFQWVRDHITAGVRFVCQNGLYDWGWLYADAGISMPPGEQLEETQALATMVDENRHRYSLEALCAWRGLPGKDDALLREGCAALGLIPKGKKKFNPAPHIWQLPARYVGRYAEQDPTSTLLLLESLDPVLDRENTRGAYRLEVDLLPMVHAMRRRGIRIDTARAEQVHDLMLARRDAVLAQLSEKHGAELGMTAVRSDKQLARICDGYGIEYPLTEKGNASFKAGRMGWMDASEHWLPQLVASARRYDNSAKFVESIVDHARNGRVFGEVHPHHSDTGGTRTLRFSYSHPALQQTPKHNAELAPLIRSIFLPEEGEVWASCDLSQQEFRLIVHYAVRHKLRGAAEMRDQYIRDPHTDIHAATAERSSGALDRQAGKTLNFGKFYGMGLRTFAHAISKPQSEAQKLYDLYDQIMPFVSQLSNKCKRAVWDTGHLTLLDAARMHFNQWAAGGKWKEGAGPCSRAEAEHRVRDPGHPWYGQRLYRADAHKALNTLIQGSAARYTKMWMREVWRAGITPMLQMHDSLDLSVSSPEQAEMVAHLGEEAIKLEVPMIVDVKFGRTWADAEHKWNELGHETKPHIELVEELPDAKAFDLPPWEDGESSRLEQDFPPVHEMPPAHDDPVTHIWRSKDYDFPCTPTGEEQTDASGRIYVQVKAPDGSSTFVPRDELALAAATTEPPSSPSPPPSSPSPPPSSPSGPSSGNGQSNFSGFTTSSTYTKTKKQTGAKLESVYVFQDADGHNYQRELKWRNPDGSKYCAQQYWVGGRWASTKPKGWIEIPYRLPELLAAPPDLPVCIPEGPKDTESLRGLGFVATTNAGGAGKFTEEHAKYFKGRQLVYVFGDNDNPGRKHVAVVTAALRDVVDNIVPITFPEMPEGKDITDWLEAGGNLNLLRMRMEEARKRSTGQATSFNAKCLKDMMFAELKYVVPGIIVEGLTLLAGKPKGGKSWMMLHAAIAVASGGITLGEQCEQGDVLYCALEDNPRRLQSRAARLLGLDQPWPERLTFICEMPRLANGGLDRVKAWIDAAEHPRLVIVDTLAMVRTPKKRDETSYDADYAAVLELRTLASQRGVAIVVVHHLRKMEADDPFDTVSGTLGLTGAPDTILVLRRLTSGAVVLHGRGRDLVEIEKALTFNMDTSTWNVEGDAAEARMSAERTAVFNAMNEIGAPASAPDIAAMAKSKVTNVRRMLVRLVKDGLVERCERGMYQITEASLLINQEGAIQ
jgi:DNA polymerase I-like protein with 3'-5' exonuclease and polymerase domains